MKQYGEYEKEQQRQEMLSILRDLYKIFHRNDGNNKDPVITIKLPPQIYNILKVISNGKSLDVNAFVKNLIIKTIKSEKSEKMEWDDIKESCLDNIETEVLSGDDLALRSVIQNSLLNSMSEILT